METLGDGPRLRAQAKEADIKRAAASSKVGTGTQTERPPPRPAPMRLALLGASCTVLFTWLGLKKRARKQKERRLQAAAADSSLADEDLIAQLRTVQSRFLANISHEIRTPLAGVLGYADQLMIDGSLTGSQHDKVTALRRCARHLANLVDDLLDLSKLEVEQAPLHDKSFSILQLLHDVASITELQIADKKVKLTIAFDSPIPEQLQTDPLRLRQILVHLLGNAVRFTQEGEVRLGLAAEPLPASDRIRLIMVVSDTGCGLSPQRETELFQGFSRKYPLFHPTSSGPGLYLSKHLAQQLGGDLDLVETKANEGSIFKCHVQAQVAGQARLLVDYVPAPSFQESASDLRAFEGKLQGLNVLLVEDGIDNQRIFGYFLRLAGARVVLETDGRKAIDRIESKKEVFDLVLMDIQLPVMDGIAVTKKLREDGFDKPIIAVSAHALHDERMRTLEQGFSDYLAKPVEIEKLIRLLMFHSGRLENTPEPLPSREAAPASGPGAILSKYHHKTIYRQMILEFVGGLDQRLQMGDEFLATENWDELSRLMHQVRGAAATYGYPLLSEKTGELEVAAKEARDNASIRPKLMSELLELKTLCGRIKAGAALDLAAN